MPRKVLITKDTLEEILAKYQGGGSGGGSGKLYEFSFTLSSYDENGDVITYQENVPYRVYYYEQNFDRLKAKLNTLSNDLHFDTAQELVTLMNNGIVANIGAEFNSQNWQTYLTISRFIINLFNESDFAIWDGYSNTNSPIRAVATGEDIKLLGLSGNGNTIIGLSGTTQQEYLCGLDVNNSCTLTEYGTSASGGSGSSVDLSNLEVGHLTFSNNQNNGIKSLGSIWSVLSLSFQTQLESYTFWAKYMCSEEEMYDLINEQLETYRQQGLTIPTVTDHTTLTNAFNIIVDALFALDSSSAGLQFAGALVTLVAPSVYGPIQSFMKDAGTTLFTIFRTGDNFGMYAMSDQGNVMNILQTLVTDIGTTKPTNISVWIND